MYIGICILYIRICCIPYIFIRYYDCGEVSKRAHSCDYINTLCTQRSSQRCGLYRRSSCLFCSGRRRLSSLVAQSGAHRCVYKAFQTYIPYICWSHAVSVYVNGTCASACVLLYKYTTYMNGTAEAMN